MDAARHRFSKAAGVTWQPTCLLLLRRRAILAAHELLERWKLRGLGGG